MIQPQEPALRAFVDRDLTALAALGGLPTNLALAQVADQLGADPTATVRWFLGSESREAFWCPAFDIDGFDDTVRIWFSDGVVVKLEGEWPELAPADLQVLGPPDLRLDHRVDVLVVEGGDHVWAGAGIAVKLNRSGSTVVGLTAFPATSPQEYRERLADVGEYREMPLPDA